MEIVDKEYLHPVPGSTMANYCIEISYCCIPWYIVGDTEEAVVKEYERLGTEDSNAEKMSLYHGDLIVSDRQLISLSYFINWTWLDMIGIETEPELSIDQVKTWMREKYGLEIVTDVTIGRMILDGTFTDRDGQKRQIERITIPYQIPKFEVEVEVDPYECCVCLEENTKEIKKCKNKHTDKICRSCVVKMDRCAICRERFWYRFDAGP